MEFWLFKPAYRGACDGQCITRDLKADGFESSLKLPDKVLTYVRDHPLMEYSVMAAPLLVRRGVTYTKIAVSHARDGEAGDVVLHLGTGERVERAEGMEEWRKEEGVCGRWS